MQPDVDARDWKLFRKQREIALAKFCDRILSEVQEIAADTDRTSHERYLAIYARIMERNREMADAFDNPRRSAMIRQLAFMRLLDLVTDEDLASFSEQTRRIVETYAKADRG